MVAETFSRPTTRARSLELAAHVKKSKTEQNNVAGRAKSAGARTNEQRNAQLINDQRKTSARTQAANLVAVRFEKGQLFFGEFGQTETLDAMLHLAPATRSSTSSTRAVARNKRTECRCSSGK